MPSYLFHFKQLVDENLCATTITGTFRLRCI